MKIDTPEVGRVDQVFEKLYPARNIDRAPGQGPPGPVRLAVYDSVSDAPQVEELGADSPSELIGLLSTRVYQVSQERGGRVPFAPIKEVVENLVHASFSEVVVSVLQGGNVIKVSDHGPGVADKTRAIQPGYSSATAATKGLIRGVGSGLAIASGAVAAVGGSLKLEDNIKNGTVVTLSVPGKAPVPKDQPATAVTTLPRLSKRQKKVLFIVLEMSSVGPSRIATELSVGLSTAYRDLQALEGLGLVKCDKQGKRALTDFGIDSLDTIMGSA